jgi:hypothetical protein
MATVLRYDLKRFLFRYLPRDSSSLTRETLKGIVLAGGYGTSPYLMSELKSWAENLLSKPKIIDLLTHA